MGISRSLRKPSEIAAKHQNIWKVVIISIFPNWKKICALISDDNDNEKLTRKPSIVVI